MTIKITESYYAAQCEWATVFTLCGLVKNIRIQMSIDWVVFLYSLLRSCPGLDTQHRCQTILNYTCTCMYLWCRKLAVYCRLSESSLCSHQYTWQGHQRISKEKYSSKWPVEFFLLNFYWLSQGKSYRNELLHILKTLLHTCMYTRGGSVLVITCHKHCHVYYAAHDTWMVVTLLWLKVILGLEIYPSGNNSNYSISQGNTSSSFNNHKKLRSRSLQFSCISFPSFEPISLWKSHSQQATVV